MTSKTEVLAPLDNSIIEQNIEYYIQLTKNPGYALFINGPWGSGKTFLIKNYFERKNIKDFIHISLYGLSNQQEIEDQFFKSLHPFMSNKALGALGSLAKTTIGIFGTSAEHINIKELLPDTTSKVIIFDDLERCLALPEALGFINRFIEYYGNRVIILGDDSKIDDQLFKEQKEKTIGRTLTVTPAFKNAFDLLISQSKENNLKSALVENFHIVKSCFERSNCRNLRTLKFCIMEFSRFFDQLPNEAKNHKVFFTVAINTFFSICLELRSGSLNVEQISDLSDAFSIKSFAPRNDESEKENPLNGIRRKHFGDKMSIEPNLRLIQAFFEFGVIDQTLMNESINNSSFFYKDTSPSWIKLWHVYSLTEKDFTKYLSETLQEFQSYRYLEVGELRHIVGILLNYSEKELIPDMDKKGAIALCKKILDHISKNNLIKIPAKEKDFEPAFEDEFSNGLQFMSFKDESFIEFSKQIKEMTKKKRDESYIEIVKDVPRLIMEDPNELWSVLTSGRENWEKYPPLYRHPVLQYLDVDTFLNALVEMNPANTSRFSVLAVLKDRYQHPSQDLLGDLVWLKSLQDKMEKRTVSMNQPTKYQFEALKGNLDNIIKDLEEWAERLKSQD